MKISQGSTQIAQQSSSVTNKGNDMAISFYDEACRSFYDEACKLALAGKSDEAFAMLGLALSTGYLYGNTEIDPDIIASHGDARCQAILEPILCKAKAFQEFWNGTAMQIPFKQNLSDDEKIAGLSKLWAEAKFNFIYFDKVPSLDWDKVYMEYLPKVRAAPSTLEYYRLLQQMYALLHDGHTSVQMPKALQDEYYAAPLLRTAHIEGKVMIIEVAPALAATGLKPGLEVVTIKDVPAIEYAHRNLPYLSASTPQFRDAIIYGRWLFSGLKNAPIKLSLRDADDATMDLSLPCASPADYQIAFQHAPMGFTMLPGNIAYVTLSSFADSKAADGFMSVFSEIAKADAMVIDVRNNSGGNGAVGHAILGCLTDKIFLGNKSETRNYKPVFRACGYPETRYAQPADELQPNPELLFSKPVILLVGPRTSSAAEDFVAAFRLMGRGKIVGEATAGSTGQPLIFPLPGGGGGYVCTKHDSFPDGTEFVGIGIQPDIIVSQTIADLRAGKDTVLETTLERLRQS